MNIQVALQQRLVAALAGLVDDPLPYKQYARPGQPGRADYQIEPKCFFELSKVLQKKPDQVVAEVVARLDIADLFDPPTITKPAYVNLNVKADALAKLVRDTAGERLGVDLPAQLRKYVIDYSSPNVAKPLHVGHIRSTIIGDALARLLKFLGHPVITDNHLGDWGLQFGMLLHGYKTMLDRDNYKIDPVQELARLYVAVRRQFRMITADDDEEKQEIDPTCPVYQACQQETAKLHAGDPENVALWQQFMPHCLAEIQQIYDRLGILKFDHMHGESFYHGLQGEVVEELLAKKLASESQGAIVIPNAKGIVPTAEQMRDEGEEPPAIIRKRDGAFTYTTSDLATIKHRMELFAPDAVLYVVGKPQELHFKTLFAQAKRWDFDKVDLQHVAFGSVLGKPDKPGDRPKLIATRAGTGALLDDLISMAIEGAKKVHEQLNAEAIDHGEEAAFDVQELRELYETVGIGAIKYADLSQSRTTDYVFDVEKMTSTKGNTATYMQYAYVRNRGIFRKGEVDPETLRQNPPPVLLPAPQERALVVMLLRFPEALEAAAADYKPNLIAAYLWDLCSAYSTFFDKCPVLKAETPELRASRLLLCDLTARVIQKALDLLGIRTVERM